MNVHSNSIFVDDTNESSQDLAQEIFRTWQDAAREWSSLYCSLEDAKGVVRAERMKQLQALENKISCIADQYELARQLSL